MFTICSYAQPTPPSGMEWQLDPELSDEFNGGFDNNKWQKVLWNYPNTPTNMLAKNSGVSDGNLWIKATLGPEPRWFESSRIYSRKQVKYPMYTESRIITAHLSAYNTFWLNDGDINNRDEIDIIENNSRPSCGCQPNFPWQMSSQYFQATNGNTVRAHGNFDNRNLSSDNPKRGVRWNEEYHTVGVWWKDANTIQFYLDGEPAGSVRTERDLTRDLNLIWDLWTADENFLGGLAVRDHLRDDSINTMRIDWVHTYSLEEGENPVPNDPAISIPGTIQVENFISKTGSLIVENTPNSNGQNLGFIRNNDNTLYEIDVTENGVYTIDAFVSSNGEGGTIEFESNNSVIGEVTVTPNNAWHDYITISVDVILDEGNQDLQLNFKGPDGFLYNIDRLEIRTSDGTLSTDEVFIDDSLAITLFPNPTANYISLTLNNSSLNIIDTTVFNLTGSNLGNLTETNSGYDLSNLSDGIYLLEVTLKNSSTNKLFKRIFKVVKN